MRFLILLTTFLFMFHANGQDTTARKNKTLALPVAFYLPETSLGFGALGIRGFYTDDKEKTPPSVLQLGVAYTLKNQILLYLPYSLYWNEDKWRANGEFGYYKYVYNYFGIGNEVNAPIENYFVKFPRVRVNVLRQMRPNFYLGGQLIFEHFDFYDYDDIGVLESSTIPGAHGGTTAGVGLLLEFDNRDNVNSTNDGFYVRLSSRFYDGNFIGDFNFNAQTFDFRYFKSISPNWIIASQFIAQSTGGTVPFYELAFLGGPKVLRGLLQDRYISDNAAILNLDLRYNIYKRFGLVFFSGVGQVYEEIDNISIKHSKPVAGIGLRFELDPEQKLNLRIDYGRSLSLGSGQFYFTIGEAF